MLSDGGTIGRVIWRTDLPLQASLHDGRHLRADSAELLACIVQLALLQTPACPLWRRPVQAGIWS